MHERRPVVFPTNVRPNLQNVIRPKPKEVAVESGVMQLAQRKSVTDDRFSLRLGISDDMSGIKQLLVSQSAE
jgi:hypothetical protein